jgi:amino acid transporter
MSARATRFAGLYVTIAAAIAIVVAPLLGLAYFAIPAGAEEETGTVAVWADPARELAGDLLTFASAERVYATYTQLFALIVPALLACAWLTYRRRRGARERLERWGWRLALPAYAALALGLAIVSLMLVAVSPSSPILDVAYMPLVFPGIVLGTIGSTVLGLGLLRSGYEPRATAWLLALVFPLWIVGDFVIGHNSLGLVPLFVAWTPTGWRLWRGEPSGFRRRPAGPDAVVPRRP